jgi:hypothetical protein
MVEREVWLNGWRRNGDTVLIQTEVHCAGCGLGLGVVCAMPNFNPPPSLPNWPFDEETCPVCRLEEVELLPLSLQERLELHKRRKVEASLGAT